MAHLIVDAGTGVVTVAQENGSEVVFTPSGSAYTALGRVAATLTGSTSAGWTLTRHGGDKLVFTHSVSPPVGSKALYLASLVDRDGNMTSFTYSGSNLATATDAAGRTLTYTWTGSHVTSVHDSASPVRTVNYSYSAASDLIGVQDVGGKWMRSPTTAATGW